MLKMRIARSVLASGLVLGFAGCISPDSPLIKQSSQGCDEFQAGSDVDASLDVDKTVLAFMQAASDFSRVADEVQDSVLVACRAMAVDLGANDDFASLGDVKAQISNENGTGACDVAGQKVEDLLVEAGTVHADVALAVSRGECHLDFDEQSKCDAACATDAPCDPGSVETRCEPGALSVMCQASCSSGSFCMGRADLPANCMGQCEATCTGACKGSCIHSDGRVTQDDPSCNGKCTSSCNGTCRGRCKIAQAIQCGTDVRCEGSCSGSYGDPVCTSEFQPPDCTSNQECHDACRAKVAADAKCDPPEIDVFVDVDAHPELAPLVATLQKNLPALISATETRGKLAFDAVNRLSQSGDAIGSKIQDLSGKSLACLGKSSTAVADAIGKFNVAIRASGNVSVTAEERTE